MFKTSLGNSSFFTNLNIQNIDNLDSLVFFGNSINSKINSSDFIIESKPTEFMFNSKFNGDIKKISFTNLKLDSPNTNLDANLDFDLPNKGKFSNVTLNFKNLNSSSFELEKVYPNIFGNILWKSSFLLRISSFFLRKSWVFLRKSCVFLQEIPVFLRISSFFLRKT